MKVLAVIMLALGAIAGFILSECDTPAGPDYDDDNIGDDEDE